MNKHLILGSKGQLGSTLCRLFERDGIDHVGYDMPQIDLMNKATYIPLIHAYSPDEIINCAAYTDVNQAENDFNKSMTINGTVLRPLVEVCNEKGIHLLHISTNYVFNGRKSGGYLENDSPDPINYYGLSKLVGEWIVKKYSSSYTIVRTADLYGNSPKSIVEKLIGLTHNSNEIKLVDDEFTAPTNVFNFAEQIYVILKNEISGIVHATSKGTCNWLEFGSFLYELIGKHTTINAVSSDMFNVKVKKPKNGVLISSVLNNSELNVMKHWKDALKNYVNMKKLNKE